MTDEAPTAAEVEALIARLIVKSTPLEREAAAALAAQAQRIAESNEHFATARGLIDEQRIRAEKETERCAKVCEDMPKSSRPLSWGEVRRRFSAAIREQAKGD